MASSRFLGSRILICTAVAATAFAGTSVPANVAPAIAASPATSADLSSARDFLESQVQAGAGADTPYILPGATDGSEDVGLTLDYLLAIDAMGGDASLVDAAFDAIVKQETLDRYLLTVDPSDGVSYTDINKSAKLVYTASRVGYSSPAVEGLAQKLARSLDSDGRAHDLASTGALDTALTNFGQSWVVIALEQIGQSNVADDAADNLVAQLCADGGIPLYYKADPDCGNVDPDTTALAAQALSFAVGASDAATTSAVNYLRAAQKADGGFTTRIMGGSEFVNVNTTSLAAGAFVAVGDTQRFARAHGYLDSARFDSSATASVRGGFAQTPESLDQQTLNDTIRRTSGQAALAFAGHNYIGSTPITNFTPADASNPPAGQPDAESDSSSSSPGNSSSNSPAAIAFGLIAAVAAIIAAIAGAMNIQLPRGI